MGSRMRHPALERGAIREGEIRMKYLNNIILSLLILPYNAFLISGCAYLVFWKGHSGWWFLLAVVLLKSVETNDDAKEKTK